jgi:hypothetical protein
MDLMHMVPPKELSNIRALFSHLFRFKELGCVLFGDKPLAFSRIFRDFKIYNPRDVDLVVSVHDVFCPVCSYRKEWASWKRYRSLFPMGRFALVEDRELGIVLVNKKECLKVITTHLTLIQKKLGTLIQPETLLEQIEQGAGLWTTLHQDHEVLGILLGFGAYNSRLFQRREELSAVLAPMMIPKNLQRCLPTHVSPSAGYATAEEELADLWKKLQIADPIGRFFPIVTMAQVIFVADHNHPETRQLRERYRAERRALQLFWQREDWFEQIVQQLISEE